MQIILHGRQLAKTDGLKEHLERRLLFALGRFGPRVKRVRVFLEDANGPRGGVDLICRMVACLERTGEVVVEGQAEEIMPLIDRTADRLGHTVSRELQRRQGNSREPG